MSLRKVIWQRSAEKNLLLFLCVKIRYCFHVLYGKYTVIKFKNGRTPTTNVFNKLVLGMSICSHSFPRLPFLGQTVCLRIKRLEENHTSDLSQVAAIDRAKSEFNRYRGLWDTLHTGPLIFVGTYRILEANEVVPPWVCRKKFSECMSSTTLAT